MYSTCNSLSSVTLSALMFDGQDPAAPLPTSILENIIVFAMPMAVANQLVNNNPFHLRRKSTTGAREERAIYCHQQHNT